MKQVHGFTGLSETYSETIDYQHPKYNLLWIAACVPLFI